MSKWVWNDATAATRLSVPARLATAAFLLATSPVRAETPAAVGHQIVQPVQLSAPIEAAAPAAEVVVAPPPQRLQRGLRPYRPIAELTADAALPEGLLPDEVGREQRDIESTDMPDVSDPRLEDCWADQTYFWSATHLCHGPLYFEQVNVERYGYQCHPLVQPLVSGAHFFLTVPTLPYQMAVHPPRECIYTLGHYRPGDRVPWQRHRLPWDSRAAAVEATVAVGLVFLIP